MRFLLVLFIGLLSLSLQAQSISYKDAAFKGAPLDYASKLDQFFRDDGFIALADSQHGIPSLGINQVYFKGEGQFVMVKYGMEGTFPYDEIVQTPSGYVVHDKVGSTNYFLYFRGINIHSVKLTLAKIKSQITTYKVPSFKIIPEARASADCGSPALVDQLTDFTKVSATMAWDFAKNCASGLGQGAWDATGGMIESAGNAIWNAVTSPIETIEKVGDTVSAFTKGLADFVKGLVTDPRGTMAKLGARVGGAWDGMTEAVSNMTTDMKIQFVCSLIGALGVDAAIIVFTGGAASGKIALTLGRIAAKFAQLSKTMGALSKMSVAARAQVGMTAEKMKTLMGRLMNGNIPEGDLKHLDGLSDVDKDFSLRTLSCYIQ